MASAQSLLGLVNQLQTMESSFCDVLMEAALKLASLTDANVFVMVETSEGRRFAGKRHLCDSYVNGGLCPIGHDVEMEVDPNVKGLRQRVLEPHNFQHRQNHSRFDPSNGNSGQVSPFANPEIFPSTQFIRKRSHLGSGLSNSHSPRSKQPKMTQAEPQTDSVVKEERDIYLDDADLSRDDNGDASGLDESALDPNSQGGDDDVIEAFDDFPARGADSDDHPTRQSHHSDSMAVTPYGTDSGSAEGYDFSWMEAWVASSAKIPALRDMSAADPEAFSNPDSPAVKLLNSFFYDCGRAMVLNLPQGMLPPPPKSFFPCSFEAMWFTEKGFLSSVIWNIAISN